MGFQVRYSGTVIVHQPPRAIARQPMRDASGNPVITGEEFSTIGFSEEEILRMYRNSEITFGIRALSEAGNTIGVNIDLITPNYHDGWVADPICGS